MIREPKRVPKSWGYELWVANSPMYCGKLLHVDDGQQCSLHYHEHKAETFYVLEGEVRLELDEHELHLRQGDVVDVYPYTRHRFQAVNGDALLLEVSTQHFEGDSHRVQD